MSTSGLSVIGVDGTGSAAITNAATGVMAGGTRTDVGGGLQSNAIRFGGTGTLTFGNYGSATTALADANAIYVISGTGATINFHAGSTTGNVVLGSGNDTVSLYTDIAGAAAVTGRIDLGAA